MSYINSLRKADYEDADDFLDRVNEVSDKIKDILSGKADLNEIDKEIKQKEEEKEKKIKIKEYLEREKAEKLQYELEHGKSGKGEGDNYLLFCKKCFREYNIEKETCAFCSTKLITKKQRHNELQEKVSDLKDKKKSKAERKMKFENWVKTEKLCKNNGFKNYEKWELYESSEDEEFNKPILPRHDPKFLALEKDMEESMKRRQREFKIAGDLKDSGNKLLKENKIKEAIEEYSKAIDTCRSMKVLYTNRALAYFRLKEYNLSLDDCNKVIEYLEVFDEEKNKNKELYVKAMLRKILCFIELGNTEESGECIECLEEYYKEIKNSGCDFNFGNLLEEIEACKKKIKAKEAYLSIKNNENSNDNTNNEEENNTNAAIKDISKSIKEFISNYWNNNNASNYINNTNNWFSFDRFKDFTKAIEKINSSISIKSTNSTSSNTKSFSIIKQLFLDNLIDEILNFLIYYTSENNLRYIKETFNWTGKDDHASILITILVSIFDNKYSQEQSELLNIFVSNSNVFERLVNIILIKDNYINKISVNTITSVFIILVRASLIDNYRNSIKNIVKIELLLEIIINNYDIHEAIKELDSKDNSNSKDSNSNASQEFIYIELYNHFLTFYSNLAYSSNLIKEKIITNQLNTKTKVYQNQKILDVLISTSIELNKRLTTNLETVNSSNNTASVNNAYALIKQNLYLNESLFSFYINILNDASFRKNISKVNNIHELLKLIISIITVKNNISNKKTFETIKNYIDKSLSIIINANNENEFLEFIIRNKISDFLLITNTEVSGITSSCKEIYSKSLMILSKLIKEDFSIMNKRIDNDNNSVILINICDFLIGNFNNNSDTSLNNNSNYTSLSIKLLALIFNLNNKQINKSSNDSNNNNKLILSKSFINKLIITKTIVQRLYVSINKDIKISQIKENEYNVNSLSFFISYYSIIIDNKELSNSNAFNETDEFLQLIIDICANGFGLLRKNSAILLAKMMKADDELNKKIRNKHGMEILMNVSSLIK